MNETRHRVEPGGSFHASVEPGVHVRPGDEIARRQAPRGVTRLSVSRRLRVPADAAADHVLVRPGERVERSGTVARSPEGREVRAGVDGWFLWYSPDDGTAVIAEFTDAGAVTSPVKGRVEEVDERGIVISVPASATRGIDGSGEPVHG